MYTYASNKQNTYMHIITAVSCDVHTHAGASSVRSELRL